MSGEETVDGAATDWREMERDALTRLRRVLVMYATSEELETLDMLLSRGDALAVVTKERDEARDTLARVEALHSPETRWQVDPDAEWSCDTAQECIDSVDGLDVLTEADLHTFEVCSECGRMEMLDEQCEGHMYQDSLWPCATRVALDAAQGTPG